MAPLWQVSSFSRQVLWLIDCDQSIGVAAVVFHGLKLLPGKSVTIEGDRKFQDVARYDLANTIATLENSGASWQVTVCFKLRRGVVNRGVLKVTIRGAYVTIAHPLDAGVFL